MHVVFTISNNSSVPYFNWMADFAGKKDSPIKLSCVCLNHVKPLMLEEMEMRGCKAYWVPFNPGRKKLSYVKSFIRLIFLFYKLKPNVVHSHLFDDSLPALFAAKICRVKARIITKADAGFHWFYMPNLVKFDLFNNWNATHIVAISEENKRFIFENEKIRNKEIKVIHHGIPSKELTEGTKEQVEMLKNKFNTDGQFVIGNVSRLIDWKGQKFILEAARVLKTKYPNIRFLLVGRGVDQELLQSKISEYQLEETVSLVGWVDRELMPAFYQLLDVYVHAASFEPFGFVIAEAMMNGIPVVSTKTGAAGDSITHLENGYLTEHEDYKGIADGIEYIHNNNSDFGEKGKQTAINMFSIEVMWRNHVDFYSKIAR